MNTMDLFDGEMPFGSDFRYETKFMETEKEIDKLTNTNDTHTINWHKIQENSFEILTTSSKDIKVFCWLLFAHFRENDFNGFIQEGNNLKFLLENHFLELFPKSKKAKSGSFLWLMVKITNFIQQHQDTFKNLPQAELNDINNFFMDINKITQDFELNIDDELKRISKLLTSFVVDEKNTTKVTTNHPLEQPTNHETNTIEDTVTDSQENITHENLDSENLTSENLTMDELKSKSLSYLQSILDMNIIEKNITSNFIKINRFINWLDILQAPAYDEDNITMLSSPSEQLINGIHLKMKSNNFMDAFFDIEGTIANSPFWITAHYLSYTCLMNLQLIDLANLVKNQVLQLIYLDDNILNCVFSNDLELADKNTKKWINEFHTTQIIEENTIQSHRVNENIDVTPITIDKISDKEELAKETAQLTGSLSQKMEILQKESTYASSLKSQVMAKLKQSRLCLDSNMYTLAFQISSEVEKELIRLNIDVWDPPLYCDSLILMNKSLSHIFNVHYHQEIFTYINQKLSFLNPTVLIP